jgi:hypothetical protein
MDDDTPTMTVRQARSLAVGAHADQRDRDGSLHIDHVARVTDAVRADAALQRVAWDCDVTAADLCEARPRAEVEAVVLLTHDDRDDARTTCSASSRRPTVDDTAAAGTHPQAGERGAVHDQRRQSRPGRSRSVRPQRSWRVGITRRTPLCR